MFSLFFNDFRRKIFFPKYFEFPGNPKHRRFMHLRYATTVRRAQGASLDIGCVYFDQKNHHAGRGYGYVAVSRFKTRAGVHVYGKLRRTDFLPVGDEQDDEVLERGWSSANTSEDEDKEHAKGIAARYADESSDEEGYLAGASDDDDDDKERQD